LLGHPILYHYEILLENFIVYEKKEKHTVHLHLSVLDMITYIVAYILFES